EGGPADQTPKDSGTVSLWEPKDWRLVRLTKTGGLLDYEQILLDGLFQDAATGPGGPSTRLSELGHGFAGRLRQAQDALYTDVARRGWFTARPDRVRRRWLLTGCALFATGTAAVAVAAAFRAPPRGPGPGGRGRDWGGAPGPAGGRAARRGDPPGPAGCSGSAAPSPPRRPGRPGPPAKLISSTTICRMRSCSGAPSSGLS